MPDSLFGPVYAYYKYYNKNSRTCHLAVTAHGGGALAVSVWVAESTGDGGEVGSGGAGRRQHYLLPLIRLLSKK